jgi:AraC-like DNA-binding protein
MGAVTPVRHAGIIGQAVAVSGPLWPLGIQPPAAISDVATSTQALSDSIRRYHLSGDFQGYQDYVDLGPEACLLISSLDRVPPMAYAQQAQDDVFMVQFRIDGQMRIQSGGAWRVADRSNCIFSYAAPGAQREVQLEAGAWRSLAFLGHRDALDRWGLAEDLAAEPGRGEPSFLWQDMPVEASMAVRSVFHSTYTGELRRAFAEAKCLEAICAVLDARNRGQNDTNIGVSVGELRRVRAANDILEAEFATPVTLYALARRVGLNRTKLASAFKSAFGVTVFDRLRDVRMAEARRLLRQGATVVEVAEAIGYESAGGFSRAFKDLFGVTPVAARDSEH